MMKKRGLKIKKFLLIVSVVVSSLFLSAIGFISYTYNKYDLNVEKLTSLNNGIKVYSANGNDSTLYNSNRSLVDITALPEYVKDAFISIEDKNFYSHNGYDIKRIIKSAWVNITSNSKSQGASTISQQLIKNALLSNEKTYSRKIQEIILSIKMEKQFSKNEILEMYLNTIYFGSNAYGLENASKIYFNKSAPNLTITEACCLAGLIKSPAFYSPITHYEKSVERKNLVAKRMFANNKLTEEALNIILKEPIILSLESNTDNAYEKEAILEACSLLSMKERDLINKNYQITTFKQDDLQAQVVKNNNNVISNAENSTQCNLDSLSIVANNNGHVLAYYANSAYNLHNLKRQPASTLKPFAVYLPCFKHNILSPASLIMDEEINYNGFSPQNADKTYHGYVSVRKALSESLNIPAVKALDYLGVKKAKESLENVGINISNSDLNLSLALGAVKDGIKIIDLVQAYTTLSNQGYYANLCFVKSISDENGNIIYSHSNHLSKVENESDCFLINDILKDCSKTGTSKRLSSLNLPIASKTGTASVQEGNTDLYNIIYSTEHVALTWIADIKNKTLPQSFKSSVLPTEINKQIFSTLYQNHKPKDFDKPKEIERCPFDAIEYETNKIIVQSNQTKERYVNYDYFKLNNLPPTLSNKNFIFDVEVTKSGININFEVKKCNEYNVFKKVNNQNVLISKIKEKTGEISIKDNDIFNYNTIEYYITDENNHILSEIKKVRPQDYLIGLYNKEILSSKKKWWV